MSLGSMVTRSICWNASYWAFEVICAFLPLDAQYETSGINGLPPTIAGYLNLGQYFSGWVAYASE